MSDFENEVKKAERELDQSLAPTGGNPFGSTAQSDEFITDLKSQAQEYGTMIHDAASKAREFATDRIAQAGDRFNELSSRDPKEYVEDAKEFARQKPGQTILISAAVGLVVGLILKAGRR